MEPTITAGPKHSNKQNLLVKIAVAGATIVVMLGTALLIVIFYIAKLFRKLKVKDPFHNSRQHPLNSPEAPRG